jgi:hypothetical protein
MPNTVVRNAIRNADSRIFLIDKRARGDHEPVYHSTLVAGAI